MYSMAAKFSILPDGSTYRPFTETPPSVVDHSLGGMIVLHYYGLYPEPRQPRRSKRGIGFPLRTVHGPPSERLRRG